MKFLAKHDYASFPETPEMAFRRAVLVRSAYVGMPLVILGLLMRHFVAPLPWPNLVANLVLLTVMILTPILARRVRSIALISLPLWVCALASITTGAWLHGGIRAPLAWGTLLIPVLAYCLGGAIMGRVGVALSVLVFGGLVLGDKMGLVHPVRFPERFLDYALFIGFFLLLFSYGIGWTFDRTRIMHGEQLIESSRLTSMATMAGGLAHEINNPLAIVAGAVEMMDRALKNPEADLRKLQRYVEKAMIAVERINSILATMRLYEIDPNATNSNAAELKEVIDVTCEAFANQFVKKGIQLEVAPCPEQIAVAATAADINQILWQLFSNAMEAVSTAADKKITLDFSIEQEWVRLLVSDSGPPMSAEVRGKIFIPFFTTRGPGPNRGLGLNIAMGIATRLGGRITLAPQAAPTLFIVTLPLAKSSIAQKLSA